MKKMIVNSLIVATLLSCNGPNEQSAQDQKPNQENPFAALI